ncbi:MAG TPA: hypothetical protein VEK12_06570 [Alphaproteobacteria bacterium]|nr:hypothetical protein [Alphaproteobacteria bacterium]
MSLTIVTRAPGATMATWLAFRERCNPISVSERHRPVHYARGGRQEDRAAAAPAG